MLLLCVFVTGAPDLHAAAEPLTHASVILTAPEDRRGEEQTFLTFPEWFLVFSPAEYAEFVRRHTPDEFCFWAHIGQFWQAYGSVIHETRSRMEPTNWGYHLMIVVIGVSTTVEYAARSAYETLFGRISAATTNSQTAEDRYAAQVARDYVDFIRRRPWFEFDFFARLKGLWQQTDATGPHMLRKWERRYALTSEYAIKAVYGWVIGKATNVTYDPVIPTTSVVVDRWPVCASPPADVTFVKESNGETLLSLPRYAPFQEPVTALARCGAQLREIAGNRSIILVSVVGSIDAALPAYGRVMAQQPIVTHPGKQRTLLIVPVTSLANALGAFEAQHVLVEHIFDY
jgi:hypothetical protein